MLSLYFRHAQNTGNRALTLADECSISAFSQNVQLDWKGATTDYVNIALDIIGSNCYFTGIKVLILGIFVSTTQCYYINLFTDSRNAACMVYPTLAVILLAYLLQESIKI